MAVLAAIVAGVVLPGLGMVWADSRTAREQIEPMIEHRRDSVLSLTASALAGPLRSGATAEVAALLKSALQDPLVCGVELRSGGVALPPPMTARCPTDTPQVWRQRPVEAGDQSVAELRLAFDDRVLDQLMRDRRNALMRLVVVQMVLGAAVLIWVLNWRLLRPIDRLKSQASSLARADNLAAPRVAWRRQDELGELGQHLNLARDRIEGLVNELEGSNAELRRLAMVDQLTNLPNRRLFRELFDHALAVARRSQHPMALMFIDLDRFKHINDTLGHPAGDELLRCIGQRLRGAMRGSDIVGRLSGDEFIALLPDAPAAEAIAHTALRVIHAIETPVPLAGKPLRMQISASIGVARYPQDGEGFDELLRHADQAMYRAKAAGRGRFAMYRESEPEQAPTTDGELAQALARRELLMHFQPVIDTTTGQAVGTEALVRWQHPREGLLPPARFIHRAEECGQIHALGQHSLHSACGQLALWKAAGFHAGSMAVNLSAGEFRHEHLPRLLAHLLDEHQIDPGELELELSTHTLMADPEFTNARVEELRAMGVALVLDDVGSAMISLSRLGQLHPAKIKIDAALVARLPQDAEARATVHAIVQLARSLSITVVASGVETEAQRDTLAAAGCHWQQGFLFSQPVPASNEPLWATPHSASIARPLVVQRGLIARTSSKRSKPH